MLLFILFRRLMALATIFFAKKRIWILHQEKRLAN